MKRKILIAILILIFVGVVVEQLLEKVWPYWRYEILYLHPMLKALILIVVFIIGIGIVTHNEGVKTNKQIDEYNKRKQK